MLIQVRSKGFFHLLSANLLLKVFGFASQIFVAWILTPEDIGRIKVLQSFMAIFVVTAGFGFNISTLKLCSENRTPGEKYYLFKKAISYTITPLFITYILISGLAYWNILSVDREINRLMIFFALGIFPLTINSLFFSFLQALKKIKNFAAIQIFTKIIGIAGIIILTYFLLIKGYVIAVVLGYTITFVFLFIYNKRKIRVESVKVLNPFKKHFKYAIYSVLANFTGILLLNSDILILNYLAKDREVFGYYSFAVLFIGLMRIMTHTVQQISFPYFSTKSQNFTKWYKTYKKYNRIMWLFSISILSGSLILIPLFMKFAFSGKYESSIIFFIILCIGWFFRSNVVIQSGALFGLGKININFFITLPILIISFITIYIFASTYGIIGAAYGVAITGVFSLIITRLSFYFVLRSEKQDF